MVRFGVFGAGMMGREHIRNLLPLPDAQVTALADPYAPSLDAALTALGDHASIERWRLAEVL